MASKAQAPAADVCRQFVAAVDELLVHTRQHRRAQGEHDLRDVMLQASAAIQNMQPRLAELGQRLADALVQANQPTEDLVRALEFAKGDVPKLCSDDSFAVTLKTWRDARLRLLDTAIRWECSPPPERTESGKGAITPAPPTARTNKREGAAPPNRGRGRPKDEETQQRADFAKAHLDLTWREMAAKYRKKYPRDTAATADSIRLAYNRICGAEERRKAP